jgi:hypothetical protein
VLLEVPGGGHVQHPGTRTGPVLEVVGRPARYEHERARRAQVSMEITDPSPAARRLFEISGLNGMGPFPA